MTWQHQRLVRVRWANRRTHKVRLFVAGICARDLQHAYQIADCVIGCMVPPSLPLDVKYQTAILSRNPTQEDLHSSRTVWETFETFSINMTPAIEYRKRRSLMK